MEKRWRRMRRCSLGVRALPRRRTPTSLRVRSSCGGSSGCSLAAPGKARMGLKVWMDRRLPVTVRWLGQKSLLCSAMVPATIPQTHKQTTLPELVPWTSINPDHWFIFPQRRLLIHNYCIHPCCYLDKTSSPGNLSTLLAFP